MPLEIQPVLTVSKGKGSEKRSKNKPGKQKKRDEFVEKQKQAATENREKEVQQMNQKPQPENDTKMTRKNKAKMPLLQQLKFVNIWLNEDLPDWLQKYAPQLADTDIQTEDTDEKQFSKFSKNDYRHLKTLLYLCKLKLKYIRLGNLKRWFDDEMEKAADDEEAQIRIQKEYYDAYQQQAAKEKKYTWVINCHEYQKTLRVLARKNKTEEGQSAQDESPKYPTYEQPSEEPEYPEPTYAKIGARAQNATAATLAALRKRLPV